MRDVLIHSNSLQLNSEIKSRFSEEIHIGSLVLCFNKRKDLFVNRFNDSIQIVDGFLFKDDVLLTGINEPLNDFSDDIDGQFTMVTLKGSGEVKFATDFINIHKYYYSTYFSDKIIISNNLDLINSLLLVYNCSKSNQLIYWAGILQSLGYRYTILGNKTILKNVYSFPNGCSGVLVDNELLISSTDKVENRSDKISTVDVVSELERNAEVISRVFDEYCFPISGGVDSRVTLLASDKLINTENTIFITHGEVNDVEVRIAKRLSELFKVKHYVFSLLDLYKSVVEVEENLKGGWNWILGKWLPVISYLKGNPNFNANRVIILGDVLDLLRAKNVKSIRSRKQRIQIQLGLISISSQKYTVKDAITKLKQEFIESLENTFDNYKALYESESVAFSDVEDDFKADFDNTCDQIKALFQPEDGYMFEEGFNLVVWGRGTMGNQARILNQYYPTYIPSANRKYVKYVLSTPFEMRFEDKLVHGLLKKTRLAKLPTSQIPFLPYRFPLFIKYGAWALRSLIDQKYMKLASKYNWKKNRLYSMQNWRLIYAEPNNRFNYQSYFQTKENEFSYPLNYYQNRASGKSRPLSEIDLTVPAQIARILIRSNFNNNK